MKSRTKSLQLTVLLYVLSYLIQENLMLMLINLLEVPVQWEQIIELLNELNLQPILLTN
jgi:hypothetical protein